MNLPEGWITEAIELEDVTLQTYRVGDASSPPLLLLHGFYESARCRYRLATDLADDFQVILYDARAHGESDAPNNGYRIENRVADLVGVVEGLNLENPILVGHSMGGSTAAWTAATHPDVPRGLVLEDPAGMRPEAESPDPDTRAKTVQEYIDDVANRSLPHLAREYGTSDSTYAHLQAVADTKLRPEIAEIARTGYPHLVDAFPQISCPSLVLRGDSDIDERVTDLDMADLFEYGRLIHIHGAGHHVFQDEYDAAYRELRAFLHRL